MKGLNFANGFLMPTGELVDHDPDHGATYVLRHRYMSELTGHMPMFNQFLHDCWGKDPDFMDKVTALQEAFGATLFGDATSFQRAFLLYGIAGTGKSRIPEILKGLLPPKDCKLDLAGGLERPLPASADAHEADELQRLALPVYGFTVEGQSITVLTQPGGGAQAKRVGRDEGARWLRQTFG